MIRGRRRHRRDDRRRRCRDRSRPAYVVIADRFLHDFVEDLLDLELAEA
jgi:hypothetical protein